MQEVVNKLAVGDSVSFEIPAKNLFEQTYKMPLPADMDSTTMVSCNMRLQQQMSEDSYKKYVNGLRKKLQRLEESKLASRLTADGDSIDAYLAEADIKAIVSESGLRYAIAREGTGISAKPGDEVVVHYAGKLLDGTYFDTSIEEVAKRQGMHNPGRDYNSGFSFNIGQGHVIKAWDEGIGYIKEGGKGTLYVPSPLGYGSRGAGPKIPPYSILVFDVEVLKVNKRSN